MNSITKESPLSEEVLAPIRELIELGVARSRSSYSDAIERAASDAMGISVGELKGRMTLCIKDILDNPYEKKFFEAVSYHHVGAGKSGSMIGMHYYYKDKFKSVIRINRLNIRQYENLSEMVPSYEEYRIKMLQ